MQRGNRAPVTEKENKRLGGLLDVDCQVFGAHSELVVLLDMRLKRRGML